jgi:hypothetical protein
MRVEIESMDLGGALVDTIDADAADHPPRIVAHDPERATWRHIVRVERE